MDLLPICSILFVIYPDQQSRRRPCKGNAYQLIWQLTPYTHTHAHIRFPECKSECKIYIHDDEIIRHYRLHTNRTHLNNRRNKPPSSVLFMGRVDRLKLSIKNTKCCSVRFGSSLFCFPLAEIKMGFWLNKWIQWWKWLIILISQPLPLTSQFFSNIKHEEFGEFDLNASRELSKRLLERTEPKSKRWTQRKNPKKKKEIKYSKLNVISDCIIVAKVCVCVSFFLLSFLSISSLIGVT